MRLSIEPRKKSDLLLQFDGSWERNWLPSSKSKMGRGSSLSSVADGHRQKYFIALQINCCTLGLKPTHGEWPSDTDLEPDLSSPSTSWVLLYFHPSHCKYSSFLFCLPLLWLSQGLKTQGIIQCNSTPCAMELVSWIQWPLLAWKSLQTKFTIMLMQTFCRHLFQDMECLWFILFGVPEYFSSQTSTDSRGF